MKKPLLAIVAACVLCVGLLVGCGQNASSNASSSAGSASSAASQGQKVKVVCATFPAYDWVMQIVGDEADAFEVTYLMDSGVDLHSYQPSVADMALINECDLFVYVGGESDEWAKDAVEAASGSSMRSVSMLEAVGDAAVEEEVVEGMQESEGHDHEAAEATEGHEGHDHDAEEGPEYDEHVWLSLRNAQTLVNVLTDEISAIDAANADTYAANAKAYNAKLAELDGQYASAVKSAAKDTVVFADRFPFRYLVDDYGIKYYAAFVGCSAETEASFETVAFLANKVDELGINVVLTIEGSDQEIAQTVVSTTQAKNQQIMVMDSLQSTTAADVKAGKSYLGTMQDNLDVLAKALS